MDAGNDASLPLLSSGGSLVFPPVPGFARPSQTASPAVLLSLLVHAGLCAIIFFCLPAIQKPQDIIKTRGTGLLEIHLAARPGEGSGGLPAAVPGGVAASVHAPAMVPVEKSALGLSAPLPDPKPKPRPVVLARSISAPKSHGQARPASPPQKQRTAERDRLAGQADGPVPAQDAAQLGGGLAGVAASPGGAPGHGASGGGMGGAGGTDALARPMTTIRPIYPEVARSRGWEGTVTLLVDVDAEGMPVQARVAKSSGHEPLDQAALKALLRWRFAPAVRNGMSVAGQVTVPVDFRLRD